MEQQVKRQQRLKKLVEEGSGNGNDGSSGEGQVSVLIETTRKRLGDLSRMLEEIGDRSTVEPYIPFRGTKTRREEDTETENKEAEDTSATEVVGRTHGHGSRSNLLGSGSSHPGSQSNLVGPNVPNLDRVRSRGLVFGGVPGGSSSSSRGQTGLQLRSVMANRQNLLKFNGDGKEDPLRHCRTCETIWSANGVTDKAEWVVQFPATLRGVAIDWYSDADKTKLATWDELLKAFETEFRFLKDDNEIVAEILSTKQGKNETVRTYSRRLKELLGKMDN